MKILDNFFALSVLLFSTSCKESPKVSFPNYGYDFPKKVSSHDSNEFYYPLKDIFSSRDSILSYEAHYLYNAYEEENLSIRPAEVPTIRLIYESMSYPIIINLVPNTIIIKQGYKGEYMPEYDVTKLMPTEQLFYFNNYFGYDSTNLSPSRLRKWDSLTKVYPMFKNPTYYNYVLNKAEMPNLDPLKYHTKRIQVSNSTYVRLINSINKSDFWNGKIKRDCVAFWTDGAGYSLEINTGKKYNVYSPRLDVPAMKQKLQKSVKT